MLRGELKGLVQFKQIEFIPNELRVNVQQKFVTFKSAKPFNPTYTRRCRYFLAFRHGGTLLFEIICLLRVKLATRQEGACRHNT
jgi:hypothetical protein